MSSSNAQMEESSFLASIKKAHSMAMQRAAAELGPEVLREYVKPIEGMVGDADPTELAVKAVGRVAEKAEEAFEQLCERRSVNGKLLALERAKEQQQQRGQQQKRRREDTVRQGHGQCITMSDLMGRTPPLPGGRQPVELVRESSMKLKLAERDRLLALAEDAERAADAAAAEVAKKEAELEELLGKVAATQQALAEASSAAR